MAFPSSVTGFARATFPIPFVPSGHFPLTRGIGLSQGGQGTGVTDCHVGAMPLLAMTGFFDNLEGTANGCPFLYNILLFLNKFPSPIV